MAEYGQYWESDTPQQKELQEKVTHFDFKLYEQNVVPYVLLKHPEWINKVSQEVRCFGQPLSSPSTTLINS